MQPDFFTVGEIAVPVYPVIIGLGMIIAALLIRYYEIPTLEVLTGRKFPESIRKYSGKTFFIVLVCTVIGARLAFVIVNPHLYLGDPVRILEVWRGGFAYHGALILSFAGAALHAYFRRMPFGTLLDIAAPYITLAYGIGRIGCFLNGCCYGKVSEVPWAMVFPAIDSLARHPTQLYATFSSLLIFVVLLYMSRRLFTAGIIPGGYVFAWFLVLHGLYRFIVEYFRVSEPALGPLTQAQAMSVVLILAGVAYILLKNPVKSAKGGVNNA